MTKAIYFAILPLFFLPSNSFPIFLFSSYISNHENISGVL